MLSQPASSPTIGALRVEEDHGVLLLRLIWELSGKIMPRKKLIAANWKMYKTPDQTRDFFAAFLGLVRGHSRDEIAVCPPFVCIPAAVEAAKGSQVTIGATMASILGPRTSA